jgi:hypothetical protein
MARSWGLRNHAVVGESGNRNQKSAAVINVIIPVIIINHCHGSKRDVVMWRVPKLMNPEII